MMHEIQVLGLLVFSLTIIGLVAVVRQRIRVRWQRPLGVFSIIGLWWLSANGCSILVFLGAAYTVYPDPVYSVPEAWFMIILAAQLSLFIAAALSALAGLVFCTHWLMLRARTWATSATTITRT